MLGRGDEGQVAVVFVVLALGLMVLVGLVSDAGMLLTARRDLLHLADGAARAGATSVDPSSVRETGAGEVDPDAARAATLWYLETAGFDGSAEVFPTPDGVSVRLAKRRAPLFGRLFGISDVEVHAESRSSPRGRG